MNIHTDGWCRAAITCTVALFLCVRLKFSEEKELSEEECPYLTVRAGLLGKIFVVIAFLLPFFGLFFLGSHNRLILCLSLVGAVSFVVLGWLVGTEQLVYNSFAGKIGALMGSFSVMCFTVAAACLWYSETGGMIREVSMIEHLHYTGETKWVELVPTDEWLHFKPYMQFSLPLATFGMIVLVSGLVLKFCYGDYDIRAETHRLGCRKYLTLTIATLLVGVSLFSFAGVWCSYGDAYAGFMTCKLDVPAAYASHTRHGYTISEETIAEHPMYVDFRFKPWLNCDFDFESRVSPSLQSNVTLEVLTEDGGEPVVRLTSSEIVYSCDLEASVPYTFRIRNTLNRSVSVFISTKIGCTSQETVLSGAVFTVAGSVTTFLLAREELKREDAK